MFLLIFVAAGKRASETLPSRWTSVSVAIQDQAMFTEPLSSHGHILHNIITFQFKNISTTG
jgi:hypothetical protein